MRQEDDPEGVFYGERVRLINRPSGSRKGRSMGSNMGAIIGQGFVAMRLRVHAQPAVDKAALAIQLRRPHLWRSYRTFSTVMGQSGSPIELQWGSKGLWTPALIGQSRPTFDHNHPRKVIEPKLSQLIHSIKRYHILENWIIVPTRTRVLKT